MLVRQFLSLVGKGLTDYALDFLFNVWHLGLASVFPLSKSFGSLYGVPSTLVSSIPLHLDWTLTMLGSRMFCYSFCQCATPLQ